MSDHLILLFSVAGLAVLFVIRAAFINPANMERLAYRASGQGMAKKVVPLVAALIVATICFALMFVMLRINPIYSFPLTGGILILGLILIAARRPR